MKTPLFLLALFGLLQTAASQTSGDAELLRNSIGEEKFDWLQENRPERAAFLAYWNIHGYYALEIPEEKIEEYEELASEIKPLYGNPPVTDQLIESGEWGLLGYDLGSSTTTRSFKMGNGKILVILSEDIVRKRYDQKNSTK